MTKDKGEKWMQDHPETDWDIPRHPVRVGEVVALGLTDGTWQRDRAVGRRNCPIGRVTAVTDWGVQVALVSFITGAFGRLASYPWPRIAEIHYAGAPNKEESIFGGPEFDIDDLARFQGQWCGPRPTDDEVRENTWDSSDHLRDDL